MSVDEEEFETGNNVEYIGLFKRFLMYTVEIIVLLVPLVIIYRITTQLAIEFQSVPLLFSKWIIVFLYNITMMVFWGGTIGKLIFGARIVNAEGNYPTVFQAVIRYSPFLISGIFSTINETTAYGFGLELGIFTGLINVAAAVFPFLLLFDVISIFFNNEKRAVHDFMANTYVIRKTSIEVFKSKAVAG